jgi:hypothetical protein
MEWKQIRVILNIGLFFNKILRKTKFFFSFSVLHQQAKTSETHAITPRLRQQHSPPPPPPIQEQHPSKYAGKNKRFSKYRFNDFF